MNIFTEKKKNTLVKNEVFTAELAAKTGDQLDDPVEKIMNDLGTAKVLLRDQVRRGITTLVEENEQLRRELAELTLGFTARWAADMKVMDMLRDRDGIVLEYPDREDMIVFLIQQLEQLEARCALLEEAKEKPRYRVQAVYSD